MATAPRERDPSATRHEHPEPPEDDWPPAFSPELPVDPLNPLLPAVPEVAPLLGR